ncbi:NADPH-dependent FMN reductase [Brevundimonas sp.]|uniref:NADPH-dependent FMN reductase n=1 Tax=Brevundimonas sp. TaxID=1871086 RepID=UPI002FC8F098
MQFLAISGSLRASSSNTSLLRAARMLAAPPLVIRLYEDLGALPHFNPDVEGGDAPLPAPVARLRRLCTDADALILSCPEYARGIPGSFKNALDWLVGSPDFAGTPVAMFNTSTRAVHAQAALKLTLETMSADVIEGACITVPLAGRTFTADEIASDPAFGDRIGEALDVLRQAVRSPAEASD